MVRRSSDGDVTHRTPVMGPDPDGASSLQDVGEPRLGSQNASRFNRDGSGDPDGISPRPAVAWSRAESTSESGSDSTWNDDAQDAVAASEEGSGGTEQEDAGHMEVSRALDEAIADGYLCDTGYACWSAESPYPRWSSDRLEGDGKEVGAPMLGEGTFTAERTSPLLAAIVDGVSGEMFGCLPFNGWGADIDDILCQGESLEYPNRV